MSDDIAASKSPDKRCHFTLKFKFLLSHFCLAKEDRQDVNNLNNRIWMSQNTYAVKVSLICSYKERKEKSKWQDIDSGVFEAESVQILFRLCLTLSHLSEQEMLK